jgi:hypothetical protein
MTSENGMPQSFFNRYGSQGGNPSIAPYNPQALPQQGNGMTNGIMGIMNMSMGR